MDRSFYLSWAKCSFSSINCIKNQGYLYKKNYLKTGCKMYIAVLYSSDENERENT